jgi:lipopolysaccharide transport protein LptA
MDASSHKRCRNAVMTVWLALAALSLQAAQPAPAGAVADIVLDAASSQIDYAANRLTFTDVTISQGELRIHADKAVANGVGLRFDDSRWEFSGNVVLQMGRGSLSANETTVRFAGNRIASAQARGSPAQFEQQVATLSKPVRGHAARIDYDIAAQSVRLTQDAWLFDGRNEINSPTLIYNIRDQIARSETRQGSSERVQITIRPETPAAPDATVKP